MGFKYREELKHLLCRKSTATAGVENNYSEMENKNHDDWAVTKVLNECVKVIKASKRKNCEDAMS